MTAPDPLRPATRAPNWMKAALVVSLSINLAVLGVVGGAALRQQDPALDGLDRRQTRIVALMPESRRAEAAAALRAQAAQVQSVKGALEAADSALLESMRSEPFAPDRLATALANRREAQTELTTLTHSQLVALTAKMTETERRELAERMDAAARRWAERRREAE